MVTETAQTTEQAPIERRLEPHKGWLVSTGDEIGKAGGQNKDWKSQGRIMLEAARHETEPLVLLNLLRYQATRNKNWLSPANLLERTERAMEECRTRSKGDDELAMELIRHLLLYSLRSYTFHAKGKGGNGG